MRNEHNSLVGMPCDTAHTNGANLTCSTRRQGDYFTLIAQIPNDGIPCTAGWMTRGRAGPADSMVWIWFRLILTTVRLESRVLKGL